MSAQIGSRLQSIFDTGLLLASAHGADEILQTTLDTGLRVCGAAVGACWSPGPGPGTEGGSWYTATGTGPLQFRGLPRARTGLGMAQSGVADPGSDPAGEESVVRSTDVSRDARFEWNLGDDPDRLSAPVRSYLAVAIRNRDGERAATLLYGHPEPDVFTEQLEPMMAILAAQAAAAIEHVRQVSQLNRELREAQAAHAAQRATSLRLQHALDAAQMGTWTWDAATGLIEFDDQAAALFGVASHEPLARDSLRRLVHREDLAFSADDLRDLATANRPYHTEYRVVQPDGGHRWVLVRGRATAAALGQAGDMIGTVQDITPRKSQEEALRTSEKLAATGRLAATIAHEINNPLEAVTNLIYLAKTDPGTPASISRMLEIADGELARVSQIAQHTLGFYRDTTRPVTINLNELLAAIVELFERKLSGKRVRCTLDLEPGLSVVGLQGEVRQVVSNLLVNAIDASPGGGAQIRIRGRHRHRAEGKGVAVLICDQGAGIPHHMRGRLFTPFVTTKASTGTGLGLWVTRGMVEKHGGSVAYRSRTMNPSGTVFRVFLPHSGVPSLFAPPSGLTIQ